MGIPIGLGLLSKWRVVGFILIDFEIFRFTQHDDYAVTMGKRQCRIRLEHDNIRLDEMLRERMKIVAAFVDAGRVPYF